MKINTHKFSFSALVLACGFMFGCSSGATDTNSDAEAEARKAKIEAAKATAEAEANIGADGKGIGPVKDVQLAELDPKLAEAGKHIFEGKCSACHQMTEQKVVGPGLQGITEKRKPEWIMNMIINPEEMTKKDPIAMELLAEHLTQMTNQNVTEADARALLEYFRQNDGAN